MNYSSTSSTSNNDDDYLRVSDSALQAEGGDSETGSQSNDAEGAAADINVEEVEVVEHDHDHSEEENDDFNILNQQNFDKDEIAKLVLEGKKKENQVVDEQAMRVFDTMISFGDDQNSDEDSRTDAEHSAIDGEGEETKLWPFLTTQYQVAGKIKLNIPAFNN